MIEGGKSNSRKSNSRKSNSEITKKCDSKPNDENSLQTIINDILKNDNIYLYKDVCKEEGKVIHNYYVFNQLPPDSLNTRNYDSIDNFNSIEHSNAPKFYKTRSIHLKVIKLPTMKQLQSLLPLFTVI